MREPENGQAVLKAIFWDNDGVLVDTEELFFDATRVVLAQAGYVLTSEQFVDVALRQGRSVFDLLGEAVSAPAIEDLRATRNALYAQRLAAGVPPLDGVEALLRDLHGHVTLAVVTSCNPEHFELIHRNSGLLRYFDFVLSNRDYERTKPDPSPYLAALARCGLAPDECIAIEDSERGLAAALAAGLRCVVAPRGLTRGGTFAGAYRVVDEVREIAVVLAPLLAET